MKSAQRILAALVLAACWLAVMCSCATTTVRVVTTDKHGTVTETTTTSRASDPAALSLAGQIATAYAPRGIVVRQEKSATPADLHRILRGRPITRQEIANRWHPPEP